MKLLKFIRDDYFKNDPMDPLNKTLMTLAAYNAGRDASNNAASYRS